MVYGSVPAGQGSEDRELTRAELFLRSYRVLEGLLEKRYAGKKKSASSVVVEYLRDPDSVEIRTDLDMMREIRNILSHNADSNGGSVVEPSQEVLEKLEKIILHAQTPHSAADFGTPAEKVLFAHPNDMAFAVMRRMIKLGYSHAPIIDHGSVVGIFAKSSVFDYAASNGFERYNQEMRIADFAEYTRLDASSGDRYMFVSANASIAEVRDAFNEYKERSRRLRMVLVTETGALDEPLICILTPWDVLGENAQKGDEANG